MKLIGIECSGDDRRGSVFAMANLPVVWWSRGPTPTPLAVAGSLGWLEDLGRETGVEFRCLQESEAAELRSAHTHHFCENMVRQGASAPALWARSESRNTRLIGLSWSDEAQTILVLPESGIRSVADLAGRRLGIPRRPGAPIDMFAAAALRGFLSVLSVEDLGPSDARFVYIPAGIPRSARRVVPRHGRARGFYAAEASALLQGDVDAIFVRGALGAETASQIGATVLYDLGTHPNPLVRANNGTPRPLTVSGPLLQSHRYLVDALVSRLGAVADWARSQPLEAERAVSQYAGLGRPWLSRGYGEGLHTHLRLDLDATSIAALEDFKAFLIQWGFLHHDFAVAQWLERGPLAAAWAGPTRGVA